MDTLEDYFVRHFLNRYGAVSRTVEQDTRKVTHHLIEKLAMSDRELVDTLTHIMVQEAMQNAQRTYVMMPTPVVLAMVSDAFSDVAHGNRSDTKTILAYDALKAMPRMEETGFHALSLLLIFHYSRNTDNVDALHLKNIQKSTSRLLWVSFRTNTAAISSSSTCTAFLLKIKRILSDRCCMIHIPSSLPSAAA